MNVRTLPLGVDIGATRLRVVASHATSEGPRISAVAVRDIPDGSSSSGALAEPEFVAALIEEAVRELRTRERRCVCSIGEPDAIVRNVSFPKMTSLERERAARFEAARHAEFALEEATVRVHALGKSSQQWMLGVARSAAIKTRIAALRGARLKPVGMDHESCALQRAFAGFDAVLDVGYRRTCLHAFGSQGLRTWYLFAGGIDVTHGIGRDLSIDAGTAEKRKRILGTAGAGERARAALAADIASLVDAVRDNRPLRRIALVGNGARLPRLAADVETRSGVLCEFAISDVLRSDAYPEDVLRSSSLDWTLAAALAAWKEA